MTEKAPGKGERPHGPGGSGSQERGPASATSSAWAKSARSSTTSASQSGLGDRPEDSHGSHGGRPGSWAAVAIMVIGFTVGGVALCIGPLWVMFWTGAGIIAAGFIVGGVVHIFADVVVDAPRVIPEIVDYTVFGSRSSKRRGGLAGETLDKPVHTDTHQIPHG